MKDIKKVAGQINSSSAGESERWDVDYYRKNARKTHGKGTIAKSAKSVTKADSPHESVTEGIFNAVYGAELWGQYNQTSNAFSVLPSQPWQKSGWRVIANRASTTNDGAVAESGQIPDSIQPDYRELSASIKTTAHVGEVSQVQQILANSDDDAVGDIADVTQYIGEQHKRDLSNQLLAPVQEATGESMTSLDKIVSSTAEANASGIDAGDVDVFGIDRSSSPYAEAVVKENAGTARTLTDNMVNELIADVNTEVGNSIGNRFWFTGQDTVAEIRKLYEDQVRYPFSEDTVSIDVNGVSTVAGEGGSEAGMRVQTLYGYPIITSDQVPTGPADGISKLFLLDTGDPEGKGIPRLGIDVAQPTTVYEAGVGTSDENPFTIGKFTGKMMAQTLGEVKCRRFNGQGKITDLKAA